MPHKNKAYAAIAGTNTKLSPMARQLIGELGHYRETWSETIVRVLTVVKSHAEAEPAFKALLNQGLPGGWDRG